MTSIIVVNGYRIIQYNTLLLYRRVLYYILPCTRDPALSIQVIASRGILDDIPPPIYHP